MTDEVAYQAQLYFEGGGGGNRRGGDRTELCNLVYLSAKHPDRTCCWGLESKFLGRQKRNG